MGDLKKRTKLIRARGADYIFEKRAGEGQTADVWKALRVDSEGHSRRTVAVKFLKNQSAVPWLKKEFETLTRIRSLHCAQVLAWENFDQGPGLVLEWIDGVSLYELAKSGRLKSHWAREIVCQIQQGLRELERNGFFHGDLSPSNLLIDRFGRFRLVDFACATELDGEIHGTPAYLAPERWRGAGPSIEADLFALGLIEHDVSHGFVTLPAGLEECRARAESLAVSESSQFLSVDPARRSFQEIEGENAIQVEMAKAVTEHLDIAQLMNPSTLVLPGSWRIRHPVLCLLTVFFAFLVYGQAQAPRSSKTQPRAAIEVRSHHWLRVYLNGRDAGFAPIRINRLMAGSHRVTWSNAHRSGQLRLNLKPGETLILTEKSLNVSAVSVKAMSGRSSNEP